MATERISIATKEQPVVMGHNLQVNHKNKLKPVTLYDREQL